MYAEFGHVVFGLDHDIEQMRHRRALVAADIGDARLQQRLGDRQYAFAMEGRTRSLAQLADFTAEGNFH